MMEMNEKESDEGWSVEEIGKKNSKSFFFRNWLEKKKKEYVGPTIKDWILSLWLILNVKMYSMLRICLREND